MPGRDTLHTDLYQLTMAAGYFAHGRHQRRVSFELFVRRLPKHRRYLVVTGLERVVEFLRNLAFTESQIAFLREVPPLRRAFSHDFVEYLRGFRFRGDLWAMPEGTVAFANEPLLRVTGSLLEAQLVETFLLSTINTETAVASKAARIVSAAQGRGVLEFGSRRTSPDDAVRSARAAFIAGFAGTSNVEAGYRFDIPLAGTAAHSWTMSHATELEAFQNYASVFPKHSVLLVDTYASLRGIDRAIQAAGDRLAGVRLDSGDLSSLAREARQRLDQAGLREAKIVASGDLDEHRITRLLQEGAPIDLFGVGTEVVRAKDDPTIGGVYKLVHDHTDDRPVAKLSEGKATLPGLHQVFRVQRDGLAEYDVVGTLPEFHVDSEPLLCEWMREGRLIRELPHLAELRATARSQLASLPTSVRKLEPGTPVEAYRVRVSHALEELRESIRTEKLPAGESA